MRVRPLSSTFSQAWQSGGIRLAIEECVIQDRQIFLIRERTILKLDTVDKALRNLCSLLTAGAKNICPCLQAGGIGFSSKNILIEALNKIFDAIKDFQVLHSQMRPASEHGSSGCPGDSRP